MLAKYGGFGSQPARSTLISACADYSACFRSGLAYFGAMGTADGLTDISAIGDEVNMAARLASKAAAGEIIVSEQALREAGIDGSELEARSLELKGISEPVLVRVMRGST